MAPASSAHHDPTQHLDLRSRVDRPSSPSVPRPWRACSLIPIASATTKRCVSTTQDTNSTEANKGPTEKNNEPTVYGHVYFPPVEDNSTHRDGAIYKNKLLQQQEDWFPDLADRAETQLEPMRYSDDTPIDYVPEGKYVLCYPVDMIQFFSVVFSKSPVSDDGSVELYGYIAVRDEIDGMLNYIVNYSRDNPVVVRQGSPIGMTGPKRGIDPDYMVLIEFDLRIKNGAREEEEDQQLIDGAISHYHRRAWKPVKHRVVGDCGGAVDMVFAAMDKALEATIEVVVTSEVLSGRLSMSLSSFVLDALDDYEEIQLFHGDVHQSGPLGRFVVAVSFHNTMVLEFKVGNGVERPVSRQVKFEANKLDGCVSRLIKLNNLDSISVKVT